MMDEQSESLGGFQPILFDLMLCNLGNFEPGLLRPGQTEDYHVPGILTAHLQLDG